MKHTKGPWNISCDLGGNTKYIINNNSQQLEEVQANLRLIAAAPEMLETLILLEKYIKLVGDKVPDTRSALNICQDAIKKAKGE